MARVPVRLAEAQAAALLLSVREPLTRQRTQLVNAVRGHAAEFGLVAAKGGKGLRALLATARGALPDPAVPRKREAFAAVALALLERQIDPVEAARRNAKAAANRRAVSAGLRLPRR